MITDIDANFRGFWGQFGRWTGCEFHDEGDLTWALTGVPSPVFNFVLRSDLAPEKADPAIGNLVAEARRRGVPLRWWVSPGSQPADLAARLAGQDFVLAARMIGMSRALDHDEIVVSPPTDLSVERVIDRPSLESWCRTLRQGFGMPAFCEQPLIDLFSTFSLAAGAPMVHFLGRVRGEAVATSTLYTGAGVAGIYDVATVEASRQRGIGAAMTSAALQYGRALGLVTGVLQASEMGANVYRGLGFRDHYELFQWVWTPSA